MKLINIGFGNMVSAGRLIAIVSPDSAPIKRMVQEARDRGVLIDATYAGGPGRCSLWTTTTWCSPPFRRRRWPTAWPMMVRRNWNESEKERGQLIVLSGPSGVGKSTVIAELFAQRSNIYFSVSYTTRQPRVGEQDGVNYNFVSREEFERMIADDELLEYAEYVDNYYGTSMKLIQEKLDAGIDVLLDIEVQGAAKGARPVSGRPVHLHHPALF